MRILLGGILAVVAIAAMPAATSAQSHPQAAAPPPSRPAAPPPARPAAPPPSRPAPPPRAAIPVQHESGFGLPHDINPPQPQLPVARPAPGSVHATYTHTVHNMNVTGGPYRGTFNGRVIYNPRRWNNWGWNRGVPWYPAPTYWGGGFWGPYAFSGLAVGILFGSIVDYQNQDIYPSYEAGPNSPGEQLLQNYGLQQTQCGPPNLVVIWGPDNSVICAYPNDLVAAGNYELDPTTLSIVSQ